MNSTAKKVVGLALVGVVIAAYLKRPQGKIVINKDGSGYAEIGTQKAYFKTGQGVVLKTWNFFELSASATEFTFRRFNTVFSSGGINQFTGGNSDIKIIHN